MLLPHFSYHVILQVEITHQASAHQETSALMSAISQSPVRGRYKQKGRDRSQENDQEKEREEREKREKSDYTQVKDGKNSGKEINSAAVTSPKSMKDDPVIPNKSTAAVTEERVGSSSQPHVEPIAHTKSSGFADFIAATAQKILSLSEAPPAPSAAELRVLRSTLDALSDNKLQSIFKKVCFLSTLLPILTYTSQIYTSYRI